ncbi:MAG: hypothetical protein L3V56_00865 [Candidatus Magnetoovum sp. WYHC-5]|nr:hypothetical protein [Candidatus Magnetoovum sp. WYHC-5]
MKKIVLLSLILLMVFALNAEAKVWEAPSPDEELTLQIYDFFEFNDNSMWSITYNNSKDTAIAARLNKNGQPMQYLYADFFDTYYELYEVIDGSWVFMGTFFY